MSSISNITLPDNNNYKFKDSSIAFATCSTGASTATKVVTVSDANFELRTGAIIGVKFTTANTASSVKLNVNSSGAKSIYYNNAVYTGTSSQICGAANCIHYYMYDGTNWCFINYSGNYNTSDTYPSAYCGTGAGTAAKTATCTNYALRSKSYLHVLVVYSNTNQGALTLNVNSKGAKPIYINGAASSSSNYTLPAGPYFVYYDGTNYYFRTDGVLTASITGSASSATTATTATTANALNNTGGRITSADTLYGDGKLRYQIASSSMTTNKPPVGDSQILHLAWDNNGKWDSQVAVSHTNPSHMAIRGQGGSDTWGSWNTVLDSSNYSDYTVTKTGGGASGNWGISITGNASTATSATSATTAENVTGVVATANGGTGNTTGTATYVSTSADTSSTIYPIGVTSGATTAVKRDTSITMVGGKITATTFEGNLSGTADSATNATKATQDGSGNVITSTYVKKSGDTITGTLILSRTTDAAGTANNAPALIIGGTATTAHLEADANELMAKSNGTTPTLLYLNWDGGAVATGVGGIQTKGSIRVGATAESVGGCVQQYNASTRALDFIFT